MTQYIDKAAVVAEIERLRSLTKEQVCGCLTSDYKGGINKMAELILSFLDTLETKEVDLEKEIDDYIDHKEVWEIQEAPLISIEDAAKHFFEFGLKAMKGE